jgi:hypothetical protein
MLSALGLAWAIFCFAQVWWVPGHPEAESLIFTGILALVIASIAPGITFLDWRHTRF